jgi:hypothetical protein
MEQNELKPCPFCGSDAYIKRIGNEHCKKMQVKVVCSKLGCFAYQQCSTLVKHCGHNWEWLTGKAIAAWNTRPDHIPGGGKKVDVASPMPISELPKD